MNSDGEPSGLSRGQYSQNQKNPSSDKYPREHLITLWQTNITLAGKSIFQQQ